MLKSKCFLSLLGLLLSTASFAADLPPSSAPQEAPALRVRPGGRLQDLQASENGLAKWQAGSDKKSDSSKWNHADLLETLGQAQSLAGSESQAILSFDRTKRLSERLRKEKNVAEPQQLSKLQHAKAEDAIAAIVKTAADRQIVILNEAHNVSVHRAFAMKLARELRRKGFDYLACETFSIDLAKPMSRSYVHINEGFYSREPMYATFLMDAASDGWKFVSYEPNSNARLRDALMARNIIARILDKDPKARIFVYVGYGHGSKMPASVRDDDDDSHLGAQLRRLTGIDPLSIDQVTLFPHYQQRDQQALYRAAIKAHPRKEPFVLSSPDGQFLTVGKLPGQYDMQVVYPSYGTDKATLRPAWMAELAGLTPVKAPLELLPKTGMRLLYAFSADAPDEAVALDIIQAKAGQATPSFMLPPGKYRYRYED